MATAHKITVESLKVTVFTAHADECEGVNLDGETDPDLMEFWSVASRNPGIVGKLLFPSQNKGRMRATRDLANYASNKATAMTCRVRGDIQAAKIYEHCADLCYNDLPEWAKW